MYVAGDLRTAQLVSLLTIVGAIILMVYRRKTNTVRYIHVSREKKRKSSNTNKSKSKNKNSKKKKK